MTNNDSSFLQASSLKPLRSVFNAFLDLCIKLINEEVAERRSLMLLRRCSGDSSAGIAVIFSGQACECFEGFLLKCCENRLMNEAPTQIIFALFKYSCLLVIVLDITGIIFLYLYKPEVRSRAFCVAISSRFWIW